MGAEPTPPRLFFQQFSPLSDRLRIFYAFRSQLDFYCHGNAIQGPTRRKHRRCERLYLVQLYGDLARTEGEAARLHPMGPPIPAPLSWDDVVNIVEDGSMEQLVRLGRSAAQLAVYVAFLQQVSQEYASVSDMIRVRVLGWTPTQGPGAQGRASDPGRECAPRSGAGGSARGRVVVQRADGAFAGARARRHRQPLSFLLDATCV